MNISTKYNIGDVIEICGVSYKVISVHIYVSNFVQTERYYFGNGLWLTLGKGLFVEDNQ